MTPRAIVHSVDTAEGLAWLRALVLSYVRSHPGAAEDVILRHVDKSTPDDYEGTCPEHRAVNLLAELAEGGTLRWYEQKKKPDAPLRYRVVSAGAQS